MKLFALLMLTSCAVFVGGCANMAQRGARTGPAMLPGEPIAPPPLAPATNTISVTGRTSAAASDTLYNMDGPGESRKSSTPKKTTASAKKSSSRKVVSKPDTGDESKPVRSVASAKPVPAPEATPEEPASRPAEPPKDPGEDAIVDEAAIPAPQPAAAPSAPPADPMEGLAIPAPKTRD